MDKSTKNAYELIFILKEDKEDILKKISQSVSDSGGTVANQETWGKKTFTYPVKKQSSGYYFLWSIQLPQDNLKTFEKNIRFNEDILRYLLLTSE